MRCDMKHYYLPITFFLINLTVATAQTFTGPTEVCQNKGYTYSYYDDVQYNSIEWSASGGGTIVKTVGLTATAKFSSSGSITVELYYYGSLRSSDTKNVSVYSPGSLSGPSQSCSGSAVSLSISGGTGSTFMWQYSTDGTNFYNIGSYGTSITQYPTTTTYYRSYPSTCANNPSNVKMVTVYPYPTTYAVGDGGGFCSGSSGSTVSLNGSQSGVSYQLKRNGSDYGSAVGGTGGALTWSNLTSTGTYTITANSSGCIATMSGSTSVYVNSLPSQYNLIGGGAYCSGGSGSNVFLLYSQSSSYSYQLYLNGNPHGSAKSGVYGQLAWTGLTAPGTYTVLATNTSTGCNSWMNGSPVVSIDPVPNVYTLSGPNGYCPGSSGVTISLSSSQTGVNYYLKIDGSSTGPTTSGTGGELSWTNLTAVGTYTVLATNSSMCSSSMTGEIAVSVYPLPTVYSMGGGGSYCPGGSGVSVTLSGSQTGTNYQLKANGTNLGSPLAGNNGVLEWPYQTTAGNYTVVATNATTGCVNAMSGSTTVSIYPLSVGGTLSPSHSDHYSTTNSGTITLTGETGSVQRWEKFYGANWTTISNTTNTLNYTDLDAVTTYRAVVQSGTCNETNSSTATINIYPTPVITSSQEYISYGGEVDFTTTNAFAEYQWFKSGVALDDDTLRNFTARQPGLYKVRVKGSSSASVTYSNEIEVKSTMDGTVAFPYGKKNIKSVTRILTPGVASNVDLYSLDGDALSQTLDYQDGLGRTFQVIGVGQSPGGKDVIQPIGYSEHGLAETTYLPFVSDEKSGALREYAIRGSGGAYNTSDQYNFYQTANGVAHDTLPYATKVLSSSPLMRLKEQGAPGYDWQPGNGHTIKNDRVLNVASEVHQWKTDGTTNSYYTANTLAVSLVTDENGNKVKTYTDKMGRTILKKVEADGNVESLPWLETYYIYDEYGRVKYQVPPKAMAVLGGGSTLDVNNSSVTELIFKYTYDYLGRVVEKKVPGAAVEYIVYDQLDRVVLTQDANLRTEDKWMFVKYDIKDRPVYNGWYVNSGSRTTVQGLLDALDYDASDKWYEEVAVNATYQGYTNQSFPATNTTLLSVNYYDDYDFDHDGSPDFTYDNTHFSGQAASASTRTRGLPTGSKRRIINSAGVTSDWLIGVTFYDEYDRPIQTQSNNQLYLAGLDKQTTIYDFVKPLKSKSTHNSSASVALSIEDRMDYDHMGRVKKLYRKIGGGSEQAIAEYNYNELGQLLNKKLHDTGSGWLQQVDYTYTIRGWLNKINDPSSIGNDYFAMEMLYNESLGALNQAPKHNGNITAIKWKEGFGNEVEEDTKAFAYSYYKNDQLQKTSYGEGASFALNANAYNEEGLTYDANGNISTLQRKGKSETGTVTTIDNLTYTYASNSLNRLAQVEDASSNDQGFKNGATSSSEFTYDNSGNVNKDLNKGIDSIAYNELNKVKAVYFSGGKNLKYTYDATGAKLAMEEYDNTTLIKSTKYVGGFVYENDTLRYFASPEGRVVVDNGTYEYQYALSDHQGNTRTVFTSKEETLEFTATFETSISGLREDTDLYENVDSNNEVSFTAANHTPSGSKVYRMNQSNPSGPGIMLRVYPGDTVEPSVYAYHENSSGYGTSSTSLAAMISAIAGAFGGVNGSGGESQAIYDTFNDALGVLGLGGNQSDTYPAAYLNYLFFDEKDGYSETTQDDDSGWVPVPASAYFNKALVTFSSPIVIEKPGYIYIYLSYENESNNYVYFDDLKVNYQKSQIVQSNSYYAFGEKTSDSWTRIGHEDNFGYNSKEMQQGGLGLYDYGARLYDPVLGRWSGVDQLADKYGDVSPFAYVLNTPINAIDPDGRLVIFVNGFRMGAWNNYRGANGYNGGDMFTPSYTPPPWEHEQRFFNYDVYGYWDKSMQGGEKPVDYFTRIFNNDMNHLYVDGMYGQNSGAMERWERGWDEGFLLSNQIRDGMIKLQEGETIKLVGHSQGAAHAAGMAWSLLADGQTVEMIFYVAPHQPNQFVTHPFIFSVQASRDGDQVSSTGIMAYLQDSENVAIEFLSYYIEGLSEMSDGMGGHYVETYTGSGGVGNFINDHGDIWELMIDLGIVSVK